MQFFPCKRDRYTAALRTHLQKRLLCTDNAYIILRRLKALTLYSITTRKEKLTATDIRAFLQSVSGAALVELIKKGYFVSTEIRGNAIKLIDRERLSAVLLSLTAEAAREGKHLLVSIERNAISIITGTISPINKRISKKCGASVLSETKSGLYAVGFWAPDHSGTTEDIPSDIELLLDPLSAVRIFTSTLPDKYLQ